MRSNPPTVVDLGDCPTFFQKSAALELVGFVAATTPQVVLDKYDIITLITLKWGGGITSATFPHNPVHQLMMIDVHGAVAV